MTELWLLIGFFGCVMALVMVAGYALVLRPGGEAVAQVVIGDPVQGGGLASELLRGVGRLAPASQRDIAGLRKRLVSAGYRRPSTVPVFYGLKCASSAISMLLLGWGVIEVRDSLTAALVPALGAAVFGYTVPDRVLRSLIRSRRDRLRRALADALDLMVLCVEAGQSLDQAIIETSNELKRTHPELTKELTLVHLELRAGKSRAETLRNLSDRTGEPELKKLVNLLIQSDRFGTSLAPALRVHAKYLRIRFRQQAEEAARKISIKLLAPIFFLIFPSMLMVTAGPAVLQIFTQLLPMVSGAGE